MRARRTRSALDCTVCDSRFAGCLLPVLLAGVFCATAGAIETVTLAARPFVADSPATAFQNYFSEGRRRAASTTTAWNSDAGLSAWGPALVFPLLDRSVAANTVLGLAAPLESEGPAPALMFRTLGLYAAKTRLPFTDTPELMQAIRRNLSTIERATRNVDAFVSAPELSDWGTVGASAWVAYLELLYKDYGDLGHPGEERWPGDGARRLEQMLVRAPLAGGKGFRRDPHAEELALWPNVLAMYAFVKAYENEELVKYESAAIGTAEAVERLRNEDGSYRSGETKQDTDARANAYLAGAFVLLFKDTGDVRYRERAIALLRWLVQGAGAAAVAGDADLSAHTAYLIMLLDSVAMHADENILGRRPMRLSADVTAASRPATDAMLARLRPADFRYRELFDAVFRTLLERTPFAGGDFTYDYGDSPGCAIKVLLTASDTTVVPQIIQREARLLRWPRPRDLGEASFGVEGLFAVADRPGGADRAAAESALQRYVAITGGLAVVERYYFEWLDWFTGGGGFEYGPTVLGAHVAATQLQYAERFPRQSVVWLRPLDVGSAIIEQTSRLAWDPSRHVYRARLGSDMVVLLPNAMMILDLLQAHRLTGAAAYLTRAEETIDGLSVLWDPQRRAYFASSEQRGDNGYESLSTNSYAALALLRLFEATQKPVYRERALGVFDFIDRDLYADGIVYHHVYRGRRATGDIWCTGCNWRVLSELMELEAVK